MRMKCRLLLRQLPGRIFSGFAEEYHNEAISFVEIERYRVGHDGKVFGSGRGFLLVLPDEKRRPRDW